MLAECVCTLQAVKGLPRSSEQFGVSSDVIIGCVCQGKEGISVTVRMHSPSEEAIAGMAGAVYTPTAHTVTLCRFLLEGM